MTYLTTRAFWTATAERALKTFAQTLIAALTLGAVAGTIGVDVLSVDWATALSLSAGATLLSVLTSVASGPIGAPGSPSLTRTPTDPTD
ncbi:holin [Longispora sp. NPDC051575]|uniref:holin n=1 Tax=Longispora sp. NPDC051575 TaxID=3154943 RepID=UPI0034344B32